MFEQIRSFFSNLDINGIVGPEMEIFGFDARFVLALAVFLGALIAWEGLRQFLKRGENREEAINRRVQLLNEGKSGEDVLNLLKPQEAKPLIRNFPFVGDLPAALKASGLNMAPEVFLMACAAAFLVCAIGGSLVSNPVQVVPISAVVFLLGPLVILGSTLRKRKATLIKQLPDALDLMARGLKVGHPLNTTLQSVAEEMPDPIGTEFGLIVDQVAYGEELPDALKTLAERIDEEDIQYLAVALMMQHGTGGDLAGILRTLARVIRARMSLRRKVKAISAEGRMTAFILSSIPVLIAIFMTIMTPTYYGDVADAPSFWPVMGVIAVAVVLNAIVLFKLVNFRI
ncbi:MULTISPECIES: type II secretion system F family protein [unclassified Ruegeria]|uniref:type II secretion system F family protein n=1 Tax=unclassified Ruegeria TaxID=2625375 RepID=UPI001ADA1F80|nr:MULTISPECIES: type II secretion system F family protein [unclassified Ruegeria]MBO9411407.1 type II secretion system F family protein [Ruegeria sp. R8_1]MBO9416031.1 type II secretion system F family protein [Ruegeria sp. R8_2]